MKQILEATSNIRVGAATTFKNLSIFSLLGGEFATADYLTLDEALAQKCAEITEVSEGGSVPELKVVNSSGKPVFLLDGEELIGAKRKWRRRNTLSSAKARMCA